MHLMEQHRIARHHPAWQAIDAATFASKNLYNLAFHTKRQASFRDRRIITGKVLATDRCLSDSICQGWVMGCEAGLSYLGQSSRNFLAIRLGRRGCSGQPIAQMNRAAWASLFLPKDFMSVSNANSLFSLE